MKKDKQRTLKQNRSLHLWCELLAKGLNDSGLSMMRVLKQEAEIPWTKESVKEFLFKEMMRAMYQKESTTKLTTKELNKTSEVLIRHLGQKFSIQVDFPSLESLIMKQRISENNNS
ncbi:MAG: hypothetical protein ACTSQE_07495 [Candidatus Heimdallarchaeaceae archaeon]